MSYAWTSVPASQRWTSRRWWRMCWWAFARSATALRLRRLPPCAAPLRADPAPDTARRAGGHTRPSASCGERRNRQVDPGLLASHGQWLYWRVSAGEGDIPPIRFTPPGDGLGRSLNGVGPVDADTSD